MDFELALKNERERHEAAMKGILDILESAVATKLKKCGNFMILPNDEDVHVRIIDGAGRDVVYTVYAVGLTTSDHVIYVTGEALYHEWDRKYDSMIPMYKPCQYLNCQYRKNADNTWTEEFVKKSDYWWEFDDNARKRNVLLNKENVLMNILRIITEEA